jgi:uncharacterized surface protein with fasciclin (FAS1) repeats
MKNRNLLLTFALGAILAASSLPALAGCSSEAKATHASATATATIFQTAEQAGFTTLVAAVKAAGLDGVLNGKGPFTVFAPTDEAFAKLPAGTVESLLADPATLKSILLYHVVSGEVMAADVVKLSEAATVNGQKVAIDATKGVRVNGANVVKADIRASNGVIHVIDTVLLPKSK